MDDICGQSLKDDGFSPASEGSEQRKRFLFWSVALLGALIDILTKRIVFEFCPPEGWVVVPNVFSIVCNYNTGGVFGFGQRVPFLFIILSGICIGVVYVFYRRTVASHTLVIAGLGSILAGALGNLYDRLTQHAVRDFLHFYWGSHVWPTFNIADALLCFGVAACALFLWQSDEDKKPRVETASSLSADG